MIEQAAVQTKIATERDIQHRIPVIRPEKIVYRRLILDWRATEFK